MNSQRPSILYKYKAIQSLEDIKRLLDIFENNRMYFPNYKELNDPLEGAGHNINLHGWAGMSIYYYADKELLPIERVKKKYKILSLSEECQSPQLWAHYAGNYSGICLCFSTANSFQIVEKVLYTKDKREKNPDSEGALIECVREGLLEKHPGWSYEKEWRILEPTMKKYFQFNKKDLIGIIIGQKMDKAIQKLIINSLPPRIKVMKTCIGYQIPRINIQPYDYEYEYNGEEIHYIDNIEQYLLQ